MVIKKKIISKMVLFKKILSKKSDPNISQNAPF